MSSAGTDSDPCGEGNAAQVPQPADWAEQQRQQALDALEVLDSEPELSFEGLVQAAAAVCGTPIALISLVDRDRQWF